jgi:hypothetical protein
MKDNMSERFLVEFFSNLVEQTFKDFEVVVSDLSLITPNRLLVAIS